MLLTQQPSQVKLTFSSVRKLSMFNVLFQMYPNFHKIKVKLIFMSALIQYQRVCSQPCGAASVPQPVRCGDTGGRVACACAVVSIAEVARATTSPPDVA